MGKVISAEFLNFLNFGDYDDDEKRLVGLRQARAAGNKPLVDSSNSFNTPKHWLPSERMKITASATENTNSAAS